MDNNQNITIANKDFQNKPSGVKVMQGKADHP
jgi:hypothetical protein